MQYITAKVAPSSYCGTCICRKPRTHTHIIYIYTYTKCQMIRRGARDANIRWNYKVESQEKAWQPALATLTSMVTLGLRSNLITCSASVRIWGNGRRCNYYGNMWPLWDGDSQFCILKTFIGHLLNPSQLNAHNRCGFSYLNFTPK